MDLPTSEQRALEIAREAVVHANSEQASHLSLPVWLAEFLIEKATRPHD